MPIKEDIKTRIDILIANVETKPFNFIREEWNEIFATTNIDESSDYYIHLFTYIKKMSQQLDNSTQLNKIRIYRECLEYELVVDAMISAMPAINRTSEMVSHHPFPYDNEITYRRYKKLKYTRKTAKSMSQYNDYGIFPRYLAEDEIIGLIQIYQSPQLKDNTPKEGNLSKNEIFDILDNLQQSRTEPSYIEKKQLKHRKSYVSIWIKNQCLDDCFKEIFSNHIKQMNLGTNEISKMLHPVPFCKWIEQKLIDAYINSIIQGEFRERLSAKNMKASLKKGLKGHKRILIDKIN